MYPIEKYTFKTFQQHNEDGTTSTVVIAFSTYAGKTVKGVARCLSTDEFDLEKGKRLAAARCDYKVCLKRKKRAEAKMLEAREAFYNAKALYDRMSDYYFDANTECNESWQRLVKLTDEML